MEHLGKKVRDKITGMTGVITSKVIYLNGCIQYGVTPAYKDSHNGKYPESTWLDQGQLEILPADQVESIPISEEENGEGGPPMKCPQ